ncbi:hypothetical protein EV121DRAFT_280757 [Schizophyllum commune]
MVSTRRQSRALPPTRRVKPRSCCSDEASSESESDLTDLSPESTTESESGEDAYERRPAKRARKSAPRKAFSAKVTKANGRPRTRGKAGKLSKLVDMPLDILFETFTLLDPQDLVSLSRTSKLLRKTLLSPQTITVWKNARKRTGAPEPAPGYDEPRWANLVFGAKRCQNCDAPHVDSVDYQLLMRVCTACKKLNKFKRQYPDHDSSVLDLMRYTHVGGWAHGHETATRFYWRGDFDDVFKIVAKYTKDISLGKKNAKKAYEDYRKRRLAHICSIMKATRCPVCELGAIEERLLQLGHDKRDVAYAVRNWRITVEKKELTDAGWARIRRKWEDEVAKRRADRLDRDHKVVLDQRRQTITNLYNEAYRKTTRPGDWTSVGWLPLPSPDVVVKLDPFRELIYADVDKTISIAEFEQALQQSAPLIAKSKTENEEALRKELDQVVSDMRRSAVIPADELSAVDHVLDLALATCSNSQSSFYYTSSMSRGDYEQCLRAQDMMFCRKYYKGGYTALYSHSREALFPRYDEDLSRCVLAILQVMKLPTSTTFADLDARDAWFFCGHCPADKQYKVWGRKAFKWRAAIIHHSQRHGTSQEPEWQLPSENESLRLRDVRFAKLDEAKTWACAHCCAHLDDFRPRDQVEEHVKTAHSIEAPQVGVDILCTSASPVNTDFFRVIVDHQPVGKSKPVANREDCTSMWLCLLCPPSRRLFKLEGVMSHLQSPKHNIKACTEGMHYEKADASNSNPTPLPGVLPQKPATVASDVNILDYGTL